MSKPAFSSYQVIHWVVYQRLVWTFGERTTLREDHRVLLSLEPDCLTVTRNRKRTKHFIFIDSYTTKYSLKIQRKNVIELYETLKFWHRQEQLGQLNDSIRKPATPDRVLMMCAALHTIHNRAVTRVTPLQETRYQPKKTALVLGCELTLPSQVMIGAPVQEDCFEIKKTILVNGTEPLLVRVHE